MPSQDDGSIPSAPGALYTLVVTHFKAMHLVYTASMYAHLSTNEDIGRTIWIYTLMRPSVRALLSLSTDWKRIIVFLDVEEDELDPGHRGILTREVDAAIRVIRPLGFDEEYVFKLLREHAWRCEIYDGLTYEDLPLVREDGETDGSEAWSDDESEWTDDGLESDDERLWRGDVEDPRFDWV